MPYAIRFLSRARTEFDDLSRTYSTVFAKDFAQWLKYLAEAAEDQNFSASIDAFEVLASIDTGEPVKNRWQHFWRRLSTSDAQTQLKALLTILQKRCPPWQFRMSTAWFPLLDCVNSEIQAYYGIDHANRKIVFYMFQLGDSGSFL